MGAGAGRVDLMGSHTDYNQGYVMTMTVDRDTWMAARPREDGRMSVYSLNVEGGGEFSLDDIEHDREAPWTNYVRGVATVLQETGYDLRGFDGLVHSTIPFGSGLSSSAAIEMATAVAFRLAGGFEIDAVEMALLGQRAENEFVGVPCGILDQYSSALGLEGCSLLLDCRDLSSRAVPIAEGIAVVICDTRAERNLAGTEYRSRRAQCEEGVRILQGAYPEISALRDVSMAQFEAGAADLPDVVAKRCRFIVEENQRVLDLAEVAIRRRSRAASRALCGFLGGGERLVRDQRTRHGADDGVDAFGAGRHRRTPGGSGLWRLHGCAGGRGLRRRVSSVCGEGICPWRRHTTQRLCRHRSGWSRPSAVARGFRVAGHQLHLAWPSRPESRFRPACWRMSVLGALRFAA